MLLRYQIMTLSIGVVDLRHDLLAPGLATFLLVFMTYLAGRVHQFFKQTNEREQAFRDGYNTATRSLFSLATRATKATIDAPGDAVKPKSRPMRGFASVPGDNRHPLPARHRHPGRRKENLSDTKRIPTSPEVQEAA